MLDSAVSIELDDMLSHSHDQTTERLGKEEAEMDSSRQRGSPTDSPHYENLGECFDAKTNRLVL